MMLKPHITSARFRALDVGAGLLAVRGRLQKGFDRFKARRAAARLRRTVLAVLAVLAAYPDGVTLDEIQRQLPQVSREYLHETVRILIRDGRIKYARVQTARFSWLLKGTYWRAEDAPF